MIKILRRWRVKEVWKCSGWAYVEAPTREEAEAKLEDGEGDFDNAETTATWEYCETVGDIEELM